ncbi:tripartite tricarboxylate transporter TctB family protein [Arthrobacter pigmenti]
MKTTNLTDRRGNLVASALLLLTGVVIFTQTADLGVTTDSSDPGAGGYPRLLAGILVVLAIALAFQRGTGDPLPSRWDGARILGVVVLLLAYTFALEPLGYILATALFLAGTMLLMEIRKILPLLVVPVTFSIVLFFVFYTVFGVPLPRQLLEGLIS